VWCRRRVLCGTVSYFSVSFKYWDNQRFSVVAGMIVGYVVASKSQQGLLVLRCALNHLCLISKIK
jgi:hypothetical protein